MDKDIKDKKPEEVKPDTTQTTPQAPVTPEVVPEEVSQPSVAPEKTQESPPETSAAPATTPAVSEPVVITPPEPTLPMSSDPSTPADDGMAGYTETKSNKLIYVLVFVLVVVLLSLVGLFLYKQFMTTTAPPEEVVMEEPIVEEMISPTVVVSEDPEVAALDELDIPDLDNELESIDTDLGQL